MSTAHHTGHARFSAIKQAFLHCETMNSDNESSYSSTSSTASFAANPVDQSANDVPVLQSSHSSTCSSEDLPDPSIDHNANKCWAPLNGYLYPTARLVEYDNASLSCGLFANYRLGSPEDTCPTKDRVIRDPALARA